MMYVFIIRGGEGVERKYCRLHPLANDQQALNDVCINLERERMGRLGRLGEGVGIS